VLKNNIVTRRRRRTERINVLISGEWPSLSQNEKKTIEIAFAKGRVTTRELMEVTNRSAPFLRKLLAGLEERNLLKRNASSDTDPQQYYSLADTPNI